MTIQQGNCYKWCNSQNKTGSVLFKSLNIKIYYHWKLNQLIWTKNVTWLKCKRFDPKYFSVLQTEQSLHNDADQIENGGHSNTTMLALVPSARSVTDTFPANQGESIHCMAFVICISFLNLPFLANFYKLTGMSGTTRFWQTC